MSTNINLNLVLNRFAKLWPFSCITLKTLSAANQCHNYFENQDVNRVDYKTETDLYPSIGFCLTLPLKKEILIQCGEHITPEAYADLLIGKTWDPDMLKINYGDLAQDLYDSIAEDGYMNRKMEHIFLFDGVGGKIKFGYREFSFLVTKGMVLNVPFIKGQTVRMYCGYKNYTCNYFHTWYCSSMNLCPT